MLKIARCIQLRLQKKHKHKVNIPFYSFRCFSQKVGGWFGITAISVSEDLTAEKR